MIDLHLHLDGSLSPEFVIKAAKMQNIELPTYNPKELKQYLCVPNDCESLNDYLKCFELPLSVLQTKEAISEAVYDLKDRLKKQGMIYAEIRFAPQLHTRNGLSQKEVIQAAIAGLEKSKFKANLILCCMRGNKNYNENIETILLAKEFLGKGVCAVDLAGAEALYNTKNFEEVFDSAKKLGVPITIHAGEADGAESVKAAIEIGANRIGHGINSIYDNEVLKMLVDKQIPLEVCPTSNFQTKVVSSIEKYPIRELFESGVKLTINTDNMTVSDTNIFNEYEILKSKFGFSDEEINGMINNSIDVAFLSPIEKEKLRQNAKIEFKEISM